MISIAKQVIEYFAKLEKISIIDLKIDDKTMINEKINCFVTVI